MNLVKEVKSNLLYGLKTRLPLLYTLAMGSKKFLVSFSGRQQEQSLLKKIEVKVNGFRNCFFGYYDISPFNPRNENFIVFLVNNQSPYFAPSGKYPSYIVLYNLENGNYKILTECYAWNWQQGNRLQWISENEIIFNDYTYKQEKLVTKILNVHNDHCQLVEQPYQAVFDRQYFLTLDYNTLFDIRSEYAYAYFTSEQDHRNQVLRYDFSLGNFTAVVNLSEIRNLLQPAGTPRGEHINHLMIAPDGEKFIFIYRYTSNNKRHDYLLAYDFVSKKILSLISDETISHCTWKDEGNVLFWGVVQGKRGYFNYNCQSKKLDLVWPSERDGHPTPIGGGVFITDTYPDNRCMQKLKKIDLNSHEETQLASIYHPPFFELHTRCDLHPSISRSGKYIQVDTLSQKRRQIVIFEHA